MKFFSITIIIIVLLCNVCFSAEQIELSKKIGIGKDVFSYYSYPGLFLRFNIGDIYSLKTGGFFKFASYSPTSFDFRYSIVNVINIKRFKNFVIFCDIDSFYTLDYSAKYKTYEFQSFGIGANFGFDFYINKYISLGYKFGCYSNFLFSRTVNKVKIDVGMANITTAILNSFSIYLYFR